MKTIRTITLSMMLMVPAAMMWADNINEDKARSMAQGFLQTNTRVRTAAANKPLKLAAQSTGYYAYNIGQGNLVFQPFFKSPSHWFHTAK